MKKLKRTSTHTRHRLRGESLEYRWYLASVGWDGFGQGSASLTYYIDDVPASFGLDRVKVETAVEEAIDVWSDVIDVTFTETSFSNQFDSIDIEFSRIDGRGGTLAQAYLPDDVNRGRIAGDIEIDTSETWELGNGRGSSAFDFVSVMVHELGHALGMEHTASYGAVMYPSVSPRQSFSGLAGADVDAALARYAAAAPAFESEPIHPAVDEPFDESPAQQQPEIPNQEEPETPPTRRNPWRRGGWFGGGFWGRRGRIFASIQVERLRALEQELVAKTAADDAPNDLTPGEGHDTISVGELANTELGGEGRQNGGRGFGYRWRG